MNRVHATHWPRRAAVVGLVLLPFVAASCVSPERFAALSETAGRATPNDERKVVKSGAIELEVDSFESARAEIEQIVAEAAGFVEQSTTGDERVTLQCRVPADQLEPLMDRISALGDLTSRSLTKTDVTDRYFDLETRLRNSTALRDRLRALLERADDVGDVVAVEKELTRVQTEVETLQAQFDRLKGQVSLSSLHVTLKRERILGPLGWIGYGVYWGFRKLFVIR